MTKHSTKQSTEAAQCAAESKLHNERADCTVRALSIAADVPYSTAHRALAVCGRRKRCGIRLARVLVGAAEECGKTARFLSEKEMSIMREYNNGHALTPRTLHKHLNPRRRYVVFVRRHVFAFVDGTVHDWTIGRCHRVLKIAEITK